MSIKLFTFDKDVNLVVNKEEILTYPTFNIILRRDKGSKGDTQARLKLQAFKEFAYIYHMSDVMSKPNRSGYDSKEKIEYSTKAAGLDKDWIADDIINEAIVIYQEEQANISNDVIAELLKTFRLTKKVMIRVRESLELKLKNQAFNNDVAREVLSLIETTIRYGRDIPELSKELNKALTEIQFNADNLDLMRGNKLPVPDSANPDTAG